MNSEVSPFNINKPCLRSLRDDFESNFDGIDLSPRLLDSAQRKIAIINTANRPWAILDSSYLMDVADEYDVQEFYYSETGKAFLSSGSHLDDRVISVDQRIELLDKVEDYSPSTIYLRVSPHTKSEYLISVFRIVFPNVVLVVEPYDMSCLFEAGVLGYADEEDKDLKVAISACGVAIHYCDALVVKMGGEQFEAYSKVVSSQIITMFPSSSYAKSVLIEEGSEKSLSVLSSQRQILYAGSTSARELDSGIGSLDGANLTRYFDRVVNCQDLKLTIVNGAHTSSSEDFSAKFKSLLERYAFPEEKDKKCTYLRAVTQQELAELALNFDLGICCAHYAEDRVMDVTRISIPNRMTSYIQAGLPVIIDDRFEYAGSLIEEFGAGAVIPAGDFDSFAHTLANIDINKAKTGVMHLKRFFQDENNKNLALLLLAFR